MIFFPHLKEMSENNKMPTPLNVVGGRNPLCDHCNKPLRKLKINDSEERKLHLICIKKIKKEKYQSDLMLLYSYLKSKNIELLI